MLLKSSAIIIDYLKIRLKNQLKNWINPFLCIVNLKVSRAGYENSAARGFDGGEISGLGRGRSWMHHQVFHYFQGQIWIFWSMDNNSSDLRPHIYDHCFQLRNFTIEFALDTSRQDEVYRKVINHFFHSEFLNYLEMLYVSVRSSHPPKFCFDKILILLMEHNRANEYRSLRFDSITIMQTERMWFFCTSYSRYKICVEKKVFSKNSF